MYAIAGDVDFNRTSAGSVIVTGKPAIRTPSASFAVAVTATAPSVAVPVESTAPSEAAFAAVSAVVADGEVVIVVAVRADTQVIVAVFAEPPVNVTVDVTVVDVGAASVTVNETVHVASVTKLVAVVCRLRPAVICAVIAVPALTAPY